MPFSYHDPAHALESRRTIDGTGFGKVAIITGCSSGVGLATTQLFLSHQFEVLGVDIAEIDYEKIDPRDQERFHFHRGDLAKEGECDEVVRICVAKFGWVVLYHVTFLDSQISAGQPLFSSADDEEVCQSCYEAFGFDVR
jgi:NAD(P)-dependent dehydrogenase (short-subunit alcohol dehydrogenase family)